MIYWREIEHCSARIHSSSRGMSDLDMIFRRFRGNPNLHKYLRSGAKKEATLISLLKTPPDICSEREIYSNKNVAKLESRRGSS